MTESTSPTDAGLIQLEGVEAFAKHAVKLVQKSRRELVILSRYLDLPVYGQEGFQSALSKLVREDRNSRVRILVKEPRPLLETGHPLLTLGRRLSSKVELRKLTYEPQDDAIGYLVGDRELLLYDRADGNCQGFVNYRAAPEASALLDEFNYLWEQHGYADPAFRQLVL